MKTQFPSEREIVRQWHLVDADGQVLGRVASKAAMILMGKHKPTYTTFLDTGDHVIIINAEKIRLTGRKDAQKNLSPPFRVSGRAERSGRRENACHAPHQDVGASYRGDAAEDETRQANVPQVESLRGRQAPPSGSEAGGNGGSLEKGIWSGSYVSAVFGNRPAQNLGCEDLPAIRKRRDHRQWPDF